MAILSQLNIEQIRCFESVEIKFSDRINVIVGPNNSGKSTLLRCCMNLQYPSIFQADFRNPNGSIRFVFKDIMPSVIGMTGSSVAIVGVSCSNNGIFFRDIPNIQYSSHSVGATIIPANRPSHIFVPFLARRKAQAFSEEINSRILLNVSGTLHNLYSRIDMVATHGHPNHEEYTRLVKEITGLKITTRATENGKTAGVYIDGIFIRIDSMGDGISELASAIVEMITEQSKIFILEEPETNLHPSAIKKLAELIISSSDKNQFIIATHSNIILRELGQLQETKIFSLSHDAEINVSEVEEIENIASERVKILRAIGYEFSDFDLHSAWLFLEESSAESIINNILIPRFAPYLVGRLRTYSTAGVGGLESGVSDFHRLVVYIHLMPAYEGRVWVMSDGDAVGQAAIAAIAQKFPKIGSERARAFSKSAFEAFFPERFHDEVDAALSKTDKKERRKAKLELLTKVIDWSQANVEESSLEWSSSASEVICLLKEIEDSIRLY